MLLCGLSGEAVPCCSPGFCAVLAQPGRFPELSPGSPCPDWCWGGVPEPWPFVALVPSSAPGAAPEHRALWHCVRAGWGARVCWRSTCGQLWLLSPEVERGSVRGQSAQGCTPGPTSSSPAHCYLNLEALHEKNPEFLAPFVSTTVHRPFK